MSRHIFKKNNNKLKRILAICVVMLLLCGLVAPAFASNTEVTAQSENVQEYTEESNLQPACEADISDETSQGEGSDVETEVGISENFSDAADTQENTDQEDSDSPDGVDVISQETENNSEDFTDNADTQEKTDQEKPDQEDPDSSDEVETISQETEDSSEDFSGSSETDAETKTDAEGSVDSLAIQKDFNEQMIALMSLDDFDELETQEVTQTLLDIYPQYANYDGEMEGVSVSKAWTGDAEYNRPESITLDLYLDNQKIDTMTLTAADDWKGSFANHYPAYQMDQNGNYVLDEKGEKKLLNYEVREREVSNYTPSYGADIAQTTVDSSSVHLFVPATELQAGEKYIAVSSNQVGQQKIYRGEAWQTQNMLSSQITISDGKIKDKDGNSYNNYILMNDGDGSYGGLLWTAYDTGQNSYYMFGDVYQIWGKEPGLIEMKSTQKKMSCPKVKEVGKGTDPAIQGFYKVTGDPIGNAYKTAASSENLYFYQEVVLPEGAFNSWNKDVFVSNRYDPPIVVTPSTPAASAKTEMTVSKKWENDSENDRPESIQVTLYANGEDTGQVITLSKDNNWTTSVNDLDIYDKDGKLISYSVSEAVPDGYSVSYKYDNMESKPGTGNEGSQTKGYWVRTDKLVDGETYLIVTSPQSGNVTGMEIKEGASKFSWTSANGAGTIQVDGPITINGNTYETHITQEEAAKHTRMQWKAHAAGDSTANQVGYHHWFGLESVSNPGSYAKFNGQGDIVGSIVTEGKVYYGQQYTYDGKDSKRNGYVALDEKGNKQNRTPTVENYPNDFSYIFGAANDYFLLTNNHTGDANAQTAQTFYLYKLVPVSGPSVTIVNTKSEKTKLTVYKNWDDNNNEHKKRPESIMVELLKNGQETGQKAILSDSNQWTYTFEDLPKLDSKGKEITYSAKESGLPEGYVSSVVTGTVDGTTETIQYSYAWVPTTEMKDGGTYILAADCRGTPTTIGASGGKATLSGTGVSINSDATLTDDAGNHYSTYITDASAAGVTVWTAHGSGSSVTLETGGGYLSKANGNLENEAKKATNLQYDATNHALKTSGGKYLATNGDFNANKPAVNTYLYTRVRIQTTVTTETTQNVTTITNTYKEPQAEFILQKLDGTTNQILSGNYRFTLKDEKGEIVGKNEDVCIDAEGKIHFKDLPYGTYSLEETQAEDDYGKLPTAIHFTLTKDGIELKNAAELTSWVETDKDSDGINLINVKNYKKINMPQTGSNSRLLVMLSGIWLLAGGTLLMIDNKKKGVIRGKDSKG